VVLAAALAVTGCNRGEDHPAQALQPAGPECAAVSGVVECSGVLHPVRTFVLRLKPGERVESVRVKVGDTVAEGDILARLSNPDLQTEWLTARDRLVSVRREAAQLDALRWKKTAAESRLAELDKQMATAEALRGRVDGYDPQVHARDVRDARTRTVQEVESLERELAAGAALQQAEASVLSAREHYVLQMETQLSNLVVRAPWPGVAVRVEDPPAADGTLLEIHDRSRYSVRGTLWQNQLATVKAGSPVIVIPDFMPGCCWTGTVASVGLAAVPDAASSFPRFPVTVELAEGPDTGVLRDGMTVFMRFQTLSNSQEP
jgi:multidrug resistance efflux pump